MCSTNKTQNKIGYIIDGLSAFCSITGFTIFKVLELFCPILIQYRSLFCTAIVLLIILRYQRYVIPRYKVYKNDMPYEEAKGSGFLTFAICSIFSAIIVIQCIYLHKNTVDVSAQNIPNIDNCDNIEDHNSFNGQENNLTPLDMMIEEYIIKCTSTKVPLEELQELSNEELYYIRNGIFAYSGQYFESGYYNKFSWYVGNISKDNIWNEINTIQLENINNILKIENQRKMKENNLEEVSQNN